MDLLTSLLGLICVAVPGLAGSGYLADRLMSATNAPAPSTDPNGRNTES